MEKLERNEPELIRKMEILFRKKAEKEGAFQIDASMTERCSVHPPRRNSVPVYKKRPFEMRPFQTEIFQCQSQGNAGRACPDDGDLLAQVLNMDSVFNYPGPAN
jgi:hypothetical protein